MKTIKLYALKLLCACACLLLSSDVKAEDCHIVYGLYDKYDPYETLDEEGTAVGMNIDILKAVSKKADCTVSFVSAPWLEMLLGLENGTITMMSVSPTTNTDKFAIYLAHSTVLYRYTFTRVDSPSINNIDDLRGKTVNVINASYSDDFLSARADGLNIKIMRYPNHEDGIAALSNGQGDAFISTIVAAANVTTGESYKNIRSKGFPIFPSVYGFALNKNNTALFEKLDNALNEMKENGEYFEIMKKWASGSNRKPVWLKYVLIAAVIIIFSMLLVLAWNKSLYHQVQKKTKSLKEEIKYRKEAEQELLSSNKEYLNLSHLFKTVLETVPERIYLIDKNGTISWSNNNVSAKHFNMRQILDKIKEAAKTRKTFEINQISDEQGTWRIYAVPLVGLVDELLVVVSDIAENVRLRDEALMSARLAALGEMSASVAHEINNPAGLIGHSSDFICKASSELFKYMENLKTAPEKLCGLPFKRAVSEVVESETIINESLLRIRNTINELKEYGKIQNNHFMVTDIRDCISNVLKMSNFFIKKHTNNFTIDIRGDNFKMFANPMQIEQTILNLIQNACFAITDKNQSIICSLYKQENDSVIVIEVSDAGIGMSETVIQNACKAFYTTRREYGGTGLGLSIASRITKEHGGTLTIESKQGKGSKIKIMLPCGTETENTDEKYTASR